MREFATWVNLQQRRIASHTPLRQLADFAPTTHAKNLIPMSLTSAHFSLFTFHSSLFTFHFSLPSPLLLLFSFLTTILLDLYIKNVVLLHRI